MERVMSVEDKIRRAEEIYYKRREQEVPMREVIKRPTKEKKNLKLIKKMLKQIILCLIVYGIFYIIVNNNYIFSEDFTNKAKEILSQDINFAQIYTEVSTTINGIYDQLNGKENQNQEQGEDENENQNGEQMYDVNNQNSEENIQSNNENIGGAEEIITTEEQNVENTAGEGETEQLSQMEVDANYIKSEISFIKPVEGKISSMFGMRNPTTASVPKNHKGIDIAAETGTKIVSATDGRVILSSTKGDFGKHLQIQVNDVIIIYAHCNKLYVKEGDIIKQGQEIAEVGSTGNTTGPHLHFEIRYQDRCVNPQLIVEL